MKCKDKNNKLDIHKKKINKKKNTIKCQKIIKKEFNNKINLMKNKSKDSKVKWEIKSELFQCPSINLLMKKKPSQEKKSISKVNLQL